MVYSVKGLLGGSWFECLGACLVHAIWIRIQWFKSRIIGSHSKKSCLVQDIWVRIEIPKILCGSHTKFEFGLWAVFESKPDSNQDWIHVWVPVYYSYWATLFFFSPFSLSLLQMLPSLFLSAITEGRAPPYTATARRHLAKLIAKKIPNQNLSSSTNNNTTRPKKKKEIYWRKNWNPPTVTLDKDQGGRFFFFFF